MSIAAVEFDYLRKLVKDFSAIDIEKDKQYLAELRLTPLSSGEGCQSVQEFLHRLRGCSFGTLHRRTVDAMTNNETWFFRDCHPFTTLGDSIIPELMAKRTSERRLSVWSAACSSGQEPYSIAMLLRDKFQLPNWSFTIRATDISNAVLERAKRGVYTQLEVNRGVPALMLAKYFLHTGANWELKPEIRAMVNFEIMNLTQLWPAMPAVDIVLLRNVMIYFDVEVRKRILSQVRSILRPDGYMFLGGAETTLNLDNSYERVQLGKCVCYRLKA